MNQRIQQLEKQASDYYWSLDDGVRTADAYTQKFAELIIWECANIVQDSPWQLPQGYKSVDQAKLVKKYFGVEE